MKCQERVGQIFAAFVKHAFMAFQRRVTPNAPTIEMASKHSSDQGDIARYAVSSNLSSLNGVFRPFFKMGTSLQSIHAKSSTGDKAHSHS
jgi:hypothetical protein